ncbi:hypothetical protein [Actinomadura atramentaria]|uniref:hypothetical protein n=1 Tax=Actinomadura atramentaria TaxID=1990 RepID=UPI000527CA57|nr:hypothetical protein [Actinomadura atramentaria]
MGDVVLSLGMGVDSVGILTRFLLEPETRGFDLRDLIVMTAMTGDEFAETGEHMQRYMLPLMRTHRVRYVQLSRGGPRRGDGYVVLNDSAQPARMHMTGPWRLQDELLRNGTVPQFARNRRTCSEKSKATPLDQWKHDHLGDQPYQHILGFSAEEEKRIARDATYTSHNRQARFPLAHEWGWTRQDTLGYLHEVYGGEWPRSCCVYCPFAISDTEYLAERWRRDPDAAVLALVMERRSVTLNPRSTLFARGSAWQFARDHSLLQALACADEMLRDGTWAIYDVRRIYHAATDKTIGQPITSKKGSAWRSVTTLAEGTQSRMIRELHHLARAHRATPQVDEFNIHRLMIRCPTTPYPTTERFLSVGPAGIDDKRRKSFAGTWSKLVDQTRLAA